MRPTVFVSLAPLKPGYELVSVEQRVRLLKELTALNVPCCWYLRPLAEEWFDADLLRRLARELLPHVSHHVILSGVVMSDAIAANLGSRRLDIPDWDQSQPGRKRHLSSAFEQRVRRILASVADEMGVSLGPVMGHRLCGTNGNYAYGCLSCARQDRYCKQFQLRSYGDTVEHQDHRRLTQLLWQQAIEMRERLVLTAQQPSHEPCE